MCAQLSAARKKTLSMKVREELTQLHLLHRNSYMGERLTYYRRRAQGETQPSEYMSIIFDGENFINN